MRRRSLGGHSSSLISTAACAAPTMTAASTASRVPTLPSCARMSGCGRFCIPCWRTSLPTMTLPSGLATVTRTPCRLHAPSLGRSIFNDSALSGLRASVAGPNVSFWRPSTDETHIPQVVSRTWTASRRTTRGASSSSTTRSRRRAAFWARCKLLFLHFFRGKRQSKSTVNY